MDPIREGATGAAVEDIQERLASLGYEIDAAERDAKSFGSSTTSAVARFRIDHNMPLGGEIDSATWIELVDAGYEMGDRTLYLRLPNLHGHDVFELQERLNILGFSCGEPDGCFGVHTEAAVKQFQESQGMLADGMAFPDTYDAIDRLHHVWGGKPAAGPHPQGGMGFARAASVLENVQLSMTAEDPISRNVAGRIWNLASATSDHSGLDLIESPEHPREGDAAVIVLSTLEHKGASGVGHPPRAAARPGLRRHLHRGRRADIRGHAARRDLLGLRLLIHSLSRWQGTPAPRAWRPTPRGIGASSSG